MGRLVGVWKGDGVTLGWCHRVILLGLGGVHGDSTAVRSSSNSSIDQFYEKCSCYAIKCPE